MSRCLDGDSRFYAVVVAFFTEIGFFQIGSVVATSRNYLLRTSEVVPRFVRSLIKQLCRTARTRFTMLVNTA